MEINFYASRIDRILDNPVCSSQRIMMILDEYEALTEDGQSEFVAALVHRLLTEQTRRVYSTRSSNSSTVHNRSDTPAAIAGVQRSVRCTRTKL